MKLELMTKALQQYLLTCEQSEMIDVSQALFECAQTSERYDDRPLWKDECRVVPVNTLIDMVNELAYDDYGKLARQNNGTAPFSEFATAARNHLCFTQLTDCQLKDGYYFLADLWHDNETHSYNNPDGTYKYSDRWSLLDCIRRAYTFVHAYQITNEGCLEPEVAEMLEKLIDDMNVVLN